MLLILFLLWLVLANVFKDYTVHITTATAGAYVVLRLVKKHMKNVSHLKQKAMEYDKYRSDFVSLEKREKELEEERKKFERYRMEQRQAIDRLWEEKTKGFPWLAKAFAEYNYLQQLKEASRLERKSHPARKAAEVLREHAKIRRVLEEKLRIAQNIITYYQSLFPFLEEFTGDIEDDVLRQILERNIENPIRDVHEAGVDPVRIYLSEAEYQRLTAAQRNQLALDRYWSRRKSRWELGRDYERYIGYKYEVNGYHVYYQGILEGLDDLGRDLICKKGSETVIVQCKRWSQHKTIPEKHVMQLYGTLVKYMLDHPGERATAILYTTTRLSDRAREFAKHLSIGVVEEYPLQKYPSIKCNVSRRTGEKIYHLPFDPLYDRTVIEEERNECYVETVHEAESLGYRRAWKWKGARER